MKYGLICPICARLLWTRPQKWKPGDPVMTADAQHAGEKRRPIQSTDQVYWCGCKPSVAPKQQDLAEAR